MLRQLLLGGGNSVREQVEAAHRDQPRTQLPAAGTAPGAPCGAFPPDARDKGSEGFGLLVAKQADLDVAAKSAELARGGEPRSVGACESVPGAREAGEAGAAAVAVGSEHRADPARLLVGVAAGDDLVVVDAAEHREPRSARQDVHGGAEALGGVAGLASHGTRDSAPRRDRGAARRLGNADCIGG